MGWMAYGVVRVALLVRLCQWSCMLPFSGKRSYSPDGDDRDAVDAVAVDAVDDRDAVAA